MDDSVFLIGCRDGYPTKIIKRVFSSKNTSKKMLQYPSYRILRYVYGAVNVDEKKTNCTVWLEIVRRTF